MAIKPDDGALYNQLGNVYGAEGKVAEAKEALTKAAQTDPQMSAKAYYNLGANLVNTGKSDEAADFFKKAIEADPNYADAHYQYGICLMAKAQVDASGKITPPEGTADQFQKYLELKPDGPFAQPSKDMLAQLGEKVNTQYKAPAPIRSAEETAHEVTTAESATSKRVGRLHRRLTFFIVVIANHVPLYLVRPARGYRHLPAPDHHRRGDERVGRLRRRRTIPATRQPKGKAPRLGGDLHRDPVCGTFVAESTPYQRRTASQVFYYCSDVCREKHALVAR